MQSWCKICAKRNVFRASNFVCTKDSIDQKKILEWFGPNVSCSTCEFGNLLIPKDLVRHNT